jgi:hypothetical protein
VYPPVSTGAPFRVTSRKPAAITSTKVAAPGSRAVKRTVVREEKVRSPGLPPPSVRSSSTS